MVILSLLLFYLVGWGEPDWIFGEIYLDWMQWRLGGIGVIWGLDKKWGESGFWGRGRTNASGAT